MQKLQTQGLHHVTLVGADRQTSIDFWEGVLGMPFIFEQPNLDNAGESHIYFDPGDGRLITVFTREDRKPVHRRTPGLAASLEVLRQRGMCRGVVRHHAQDTPEPRHTLVLGTVTHAPLP